MNDAKSHLDALMRQVPPPEEVVDGHGDWSAAEAALGTGLPVDFKALVGAYGRGGFSDTISLRTPFGADNPDRLDGELLEDYGSLRDLSPERHPHPLYPEPGGLLAWATTDCAHHLCWLTEGDPDDWTVVLWSRDDDYETYDGGAVAYVEGWTGRRIESRILGEDDPDLPHWFDPAVPMDHVYVVLTEGELPYDERLRALREALAPTVDRGAYEHDGARQDHFATVVAGRRFTYERTYVHQLRVAFRAEDSGRARDAVLGAVRSMGCEVTALRTIHGTSVWKLPS